MSSHLLQRNSVASTRMQWTRAGKRLGQTSSSCSSGVLLAETRHEHVPAKGSATPVGLRFRLRATLGMNLQQFCDLRKGSSARPCLQRLPPCLSSARRYRCSSASACASSTATALEKGCLKQRASGDMAVCKGGTWCAGWYHCASASSHTFQLCFVN